MLVDGGFASLDAIDATEKRGCTVYAPVKDAEKQKKAGKDPYARKPHDTDATAAWRQRMGEEASQTMYKLRAQTAEWVNALCRNRGFWRMPVRGLEKCQQDQPERSRGKTSRIAGISRCHGLASAGARGCGITR